MSRFFAASYKHINFGGGVITVRTLIWGLWGGFTLGILLSYYHKCYLGRVVRSLIKADALTKDTSLTLDELGIKRNPLLVSALKEGASLRKAVDVANPEECVFEKEKKTPAWIKRLFPVEKKYSYDFEKMKFFITEEKKYGAALKYEQKKSVSPFLLAVLLVVLTGVAVGMTVAVPELLQMLDNFIDMYSN